MTTRLRALKRVLESAGQFELQRPSGGSHWKFVRLRDGLSYPIPAHNGLKTEIVDRYIRGLCRCFNEELDYDTLCRDL